MTAKGLAPGSSWPGEECPSHGQAPATASPEAARVSGCPSSAVAAQAELPFTQATGQLRGVTQSLMSYSFCQTGHLCASEILVPLGQHRRPAPGAALQPQPPACPPVPAAPRAGHQAFLCCKAHSPTRTSARLPTRCLTGSMSNLSISWVSFYWSFKVTGRPGSKNTNHNTNLKS